MSPAVMIVFAYAGWMGVTTDRARPPVELLDETWSKAETARTTGAARWAPGEWRLARLLLLEARASYRREQLEPRIARDFRPVEAKLLQARHALDRALRISRQRRTGHTTRARESIERAEAVLADLDRDVRLPEAVHLAASRSRAALAEARAHLASSNPLEAGLRAEYGLRAARRATRQWEEVRGRFQEGPRLAEWRTWVGETRAWSLRTGRVALVVEKDAHRLTVLRAGRAGPSWDVDLGTYSVLDKRRAGDRATPEGRYRITLLKDRGESRYHRALLLDYPNAEDLDRFRSALARGELPSDAAPGGFIEIHGEGGRGEDWTDGCVALANEALDVLYGLVDVGTPVTIVGSLGGEPVVPAGASDAGGGSDGHER